MFISSIALVAVALPFGLAHTSVVTKYVTVCEPTLPNGYTFPIAAPTYGNGGYEEGSSPSPTKGAGYGGGAGAGEGYGSVSIPGHGYGVHDPSSTCTDEASYTSVHGGGGYGSNPGHAGPGYGEGGEGTTATSSGHSATHTHSTYTFGNHSSTASGTGIVSPTKPTSTSTSSTATGFIPGCTNTPDNRAEWCGGYSIDTNLDKDWPETGKTRTYHLEITNSTGAPDGTERLLFLINNQYPGPVIEADWGDYLEITVQNSLQDNGTSMHWHGLRQLNTNTMDGTNGITECPIAPGHSRTYRFQATQHGTTWYRKSFAFTYPQSCFPL
jgi:hypothetical protein